MSSLTELSLLKAKKGLENKDFTAVELTEDYIKNCENNRNLNIFITETFDIARKQAEESDKKYQSGDSKNMSSISYAKNDSKKYPPFQGDLLHLINSKNSTNKPNKNLQLNDYKFIDLFAGIGGIRIPFDELGAECVFSSEWDKYAGQTYAANYGDVPHGDITQIDEKHIPTFDILLAGFPCQPFSNAGHKKGFDDTRGTLFFDICRIVDFHKPKVLFLENVKGFKGHNKGETFFVVKKALNELGYKVHTQILNAKHFGVPQNRERIYIIAFRDEVDFTFPIPENQKVQVGDILSKTVEEKYTISDKLWAGHKRRRLEHKAKGNGFGYCLFQADSEYTSTISARYYKDGSEILIDQGDDKNPRKLTPKEAAKLQGFPDDFTIPVSDTQAYRQFGNSVAVPVIRAIAQQIAEVLER